MSMPPVDPADAVPDVLPDPRSGVPNPPVSRPPVSRPADHLPWVTVITVVLNRAQDLPATIASVRAQTWPHLEYLVVDGGSTDGTLQVLQANEDRIDHWQSAPDRGLYDAMNKGVAQARGEWLLILNAGDCLNGTAVFECLRTATDAVDVLYANTLLMREGAPVLLPADVQQRRFVHQSMVYRKSLHVRYGPYLVAPGVTISDYLFFAMAWQPEHTRKLEHPIACYQEGGMSAQSRHHHQKLAVDLLLGRRSAIHVVLSLLSALFFASALGRPWLRWLQTRRLRRWQDGGAPRLPD